MHAKMTQTLFALAVLSTAAASQSFMMNGVPVPGGDIVNSLNPTVDINGDGRTDVVLAGAGEDLLVLLALPDGTLAPPIATSPAGTDLVALADVDNDGRDDAWFLSADAQSLLIQRGQLDGTFAYATTTPLPFTVSAVLAADLDADGVVDVALAEDMGTRLFPALGQGDGSFIATGVVSVPSWAQEIAFGDVNGDGFGDLVTRSRAFGPSIVSVAFGSGGTFAPSVVINDDSAQDMLHVANVVGNTADDIILRNFQPFGDLRALAVYEGGPHIASGGTLFDVPGAEVAGYAVADIDHDGLNDLLLQRSDALAIDVWMQDAGALQRRPPITTSPSVNAPFALADFTSDGDIDLAVLQGGEAFVRKGTGSGTFGFAAPSFESFETFTPRVGDFDEDGLPDLLTAQLLYGLNQLTHHRGIPGGGFVRRDTFEFDGVVRYASINDVDGDGHLDILIVHDEIVTLINNGAGRFNTTVVTPLPATGVSISGHFDTDDILDVMVLGDDARRFGGQGDGSFVETFSAPLTSAPSHLAVADVDGDGIDDVVAANSVKTVGVTANGILALGNGGGITLRAIEVADFDNDGVLEYALARLLAATSEPGVQVRRQDTVGGPFAPAQFLPTAAIVRDLDLADLDNDGDPDLVAAHELVTTWIDDNGGDLVLGTDYTFLDPPVRAVLTDVDGDTRLDALITSATETRVYPNVDGAWQSLGNSLAGLDGFSRLDAHGPPTSAGAITFTVRNATPHAALTLVFGGQVLAAPFKGGVLVPSPDLIQPGFTADALGEVTLNVELPKLVPAGLELVLQFWAPGANIAATSAVRGVTFNR